MSYKHNEKNRDKPDLLDQFDRPFDIFMVNGAYDGDPVPKRC
jgi:hypothetical protein